MAIAPIAASASTPSGSVRRCASRRPAATAPGAHRPPTQGLRRSSSPQKLGGVVDLQNEAEPRRRPSRPAVQRSRAARRSPSRRRRSRSSSALRSGTRPSRHTRTSCGCRSSAGRCMIPTRHRSARLGVGRLVVGGIAIATIARDLLPRDRRRPRGYVPAFTNLTPRRPARCRPPSPPPSIPSKLGRHGATVLVPSGKVDEARVAVDKAGVGQRRADWSLLDKSSAVADRRPGREGAARRARDRLATQIQNIAGVCRRDGQPGDPRSSTLFSADQEQPTASVLLDTCGASLTDTARARHPARSSRTPISGLTPAEHRPSSTRTGRSRAATSAIGVATGRCEDRRAVAARLAPDLDRARPRSTRWSASAPARRSSPAS